MVMVVLDNQVDALLYWCPPTKSGSLNSLDEAHSRSLSPRVVNTLFFSLSNIANQKKKQLPAKPKFCEYLSLFFFF